MDSWNYMSEGRGVYLSEDFDLQYDTHGYNKSQLIGHEFKPLLNVENYPLLSNTQALERLNFMEMGFSDEIRKSYSISSDPSGEVFSDEIGSDYNNVASPFDKEKYYGSRIASSVFMQSENKDFSLVDLKLGRLANGKVRKDDELSVANVPGSCIGSSPRVKRSRSTSSYIKSLRCQVLGCNKDLSSYKDYYKRNKVCDEHTRAARVTVNGMEQRFCQQCSRFHQLAEFDDDKRSCRKRLAAHNKRRRKPRFPSKPASTSQRTTPALSLLSSHSRNSASSQLLGTVTTSPMLNDSPDILDDMGQKGFLETGMYSMEADNMDPTMISNTVDLHLPSDGILREADLRDTHLGHGIILDLFELSSCLQRIQQQRHSTGSETE